MTRDEAVALFERRRDAWLAEDLDGYLAMFAEDVALVLPTGPPVRGRAQYDALVRRAAAATRPVRFDFHRIATDGPFVLAEWTIELAVRADGRRITYDGMSSCEVDASGRIVMWREYYDPAALRPG